MKTAASLIRPLVRPALQQAERFVGKQIGRNVPMVRDSATVMSLVPKSIAPKVAPKTIFTDWRNVPKMMGIGVGGAAASPFIGDRLGRMSAGPSPTERLFAPAAPASPSFFGKKGYAKKALQPWQMAAMGGLGVGALTAAASKKNKLRNAAAASAISFPAMWYLLSKYYGYTPPAPDHIRTGSTSKDKAILGAYDQGGAVGASNKAQELGVSPHHLNPLTINNPAAYARSEATQAPGAGVAGRIPGLLENETSRFGAPAQSNTPQISAPQDTPITRFYNEDERQIVENAMRRQKGGAASRMIDHTPKPNFRPVALPKTKPVALPSAADARKIIEQGNTFGVKAPPIIKGGSFIPPSPVTSFGKANKVNWRQLRFDGKKLELPKPGKLTDPKTGPEQTGKLATNLSGKGSSTTNMLRQTGHTMPFEGLGGIVKSRVSPAVNWVKRPLVGDPTTDYIEHAMKNFSRSYTPRGGMYFPGRFSKVVNN